MAAAGAHLDAGPVTVDGAPASSELRGPTMLVVPLPHALAAGRSVDVALPWHLRLAGPLDDRVSRVGDTVRLGSFFPILPWEPGVGWATERPTTLDAEASTAPTADFAMTVTVPAGLTVLASGTPDGRGRWTATAVRDVALSVGHFTTATAVAHAPEPVAVTVGVDAGVAETPQPYVDKAVRVLEDFGRRFGPYPLATYTLALTPALRGGIEYPGHVMQGAGTIGRTTSHEIGHQWFYGLVGNDQARDPWLDEGLATYAEVRFEDRLAAVQAMVVPADVRGHTGEPVGFFERMAADYYAGVYLQGTQAIASLGPPDLVDCALRRYVADRAYLIARPADLIAALSAVFPDAAVRLAAFGAHG
jgi:hypothetical protein